MAYYDFVYQDHELSLRAKVVLIYLKDHANKQGTCWPGINTIAAGVSLSRSTVKRALDDLVKAGLLEKSHRWRENGSLTSNLYRIRCVSRKSQILSQNTATSYLDAGPPEKILEGPALLYEEKQCMQPYAK